MGFFSSALPRYSGTIIHDCWSSYLTYNHCDHGLCGSHLVRELTCIVESNGYAWGSTMKDLLLDTCKTVSKKEAKKLTEEEYTDLERRYKAILANGEKELPPIPPKPCNEIFLSNIKISLIKDLYTSL